MTIEIEAKIRITDPAALRARLAVLGVHLAAPAAQQDTFFGHPSRDLVAADEALRLRQEGGCFELTYKGPRRPETSTSDRPAAKSRIEESIVVSGDPARLLGLLGFTPSAHVGKWREVGHMGNVAVAVDHVEGLGWFLELEVLAGDGGEAGRKSAEDAIESAAERLGLADAVRIRESYIELVIRAGIPHA